MTPPVGFLKHVRPLDAPVVTAVGVAETVKHWKALVILALSPPHPVSHDGTAALRSLQKPCAALCAASMLLADNMHPKQLSDGVQVAGTV